MVALYGSRNKKGHIEIHGWGCMCHMHDMYGLPMDSPNRSFLKSLVGASRKIGSVPIYVASLNGGQNSPQFFCYADLFFVFYLAFY